MWKNFSHKYSHKWVFLGAIKLDGQIMEPLTVHHLVALLLDLMDYVKRNTQRLMSGLLVGHQEKKKKK